MLRMHTNQLGNEGSLGGGGDDNGLRNIRNRVYRVAEADYINESDKSRARNIFDRTNARPALV